MSKKEETELFFSVIVPVYNVEKYISHCIESILNQSFTDFELILVVDGSPDNCLDICRNYSVEDQRVIVINKTNGGVTSARKAGCNVARGRYILFIDGDDYIHRELLSTLHAEFIAKPYLDMVCYGLNHVDEDGCVKQLTQPLPSGLYKDMGQILNDFLFDSDCGYMNFGCMSYSLCVKCAEREKYTSSIMETDESVVFGEDAVTTAILLGKIDCFEVIGFTGYYQNIHPESATYVSGFDTIKELTVMADSLRELGSIPNNNISCYYYLSIFNIIINEAIGKRPANGFIEDDSIKYNHRVQTNSIKQWLKMMFVKKKCWWVIYIIGRIHSLFRFL